MEKIHLAIIPDGNRRFGQEKQGCKLKGYNQGVRVLKRVLKWFIKNELTEEMTLYCFSEDNWKRSQDEVEYLMEIFRDFTSNVEELSIKEYLFNSLYASSDDEDTGEEEDKQIPEISIRFCSTNLNHPNLPEDIKKSIEKINQLNQEEIKTTKTSTIKNHKVINICFSYDGQKEIHQAYEKALKEESKIPSSPHEVQKYLLVKSPPNLILRTSGEKRLSSFLNWQCGYSELFFLDKKWPEITKQDLDDVISEYLKREKRFGK